MTTRRDPLLDLLLRRREPRVGLVIGGVVALLLHVAVLPGSALLPPRPVARPAGGPVAAWAGLDAASDHRRLEIELKSPATTKPPPPPKPPAPDEDPQGQVVKLPARDVKKPLAADYLAEQDQSTDRETRARITGVTETATRAPQLGRVRDTDSARDDDAGAARSAPAGDTATPGGPAGDGNSTSGDALAWDSRDPGGGAPQLALLVPRVQPREAFDVPVTDEGRLVAGEKQLAVAGNGSVLRIAMGRMATDPSTTTGAGAGEGGVGRAGGTGDGGAPGRPITLPSLGSLERLAGLPANDALTVEEDEATRLNTVEYRHATFFNRVADAIRREWVGGEVLSKADPGGSVYGFHDRVTIVHVTVDTDGNIVDLALQDTSGAEPLDEEALRAFRTAGPFPHPPAALFRGRDRFSFTFGFNVVYNRAHLDLDWRPY